MPFITYGFQDRAFLELDAAWGVNDIVIDKSRDMGATWMCLYRILHDFLFSEYAILGLVSKNADSVDAPDDPDALMQKMDFALDMQPWFLKPRMNRSQFRFKNLKTSSTIHGFPATGDVARGGRKRVMLMDEFAAFRNQEDYLALSSTQYATYCRIFLSTFSGPTGAFYDIARGEMDKKKTMVVLDWKDHPIKRQGLYTSENSRLKILDKSYKFPPKYNFIKDGKVRSVYYDGECDRPGATPASVGRELDRDPGEAGGAYFDLQNISKAKLKCHPPMNEGRMNYDPESFEPHYVAAEGGPLDLWIPVDGVGKIASYDRFVVGCDVSAATGGGYGSNSTGVVLNRGTKVQAAEYCSNTRDDRPQYFAARMIALAKWFNNALLIWEANGAPGVEFTEVVSESGYPFIYYRSVNIGNTDRKPTRKAGWWTDEKTKSILLGAYQKAIDTEEIKIQSVNQLNECIQYVWKGGKVVHDRSIRTSDESAKGRAHGDLVIGGALANWALRETPITKDNYEHVPMTPQRGSMAYRFEKTEQERSNQKESLTVW